MKKMRLCKLNLNKIKAQLRILKLHSRWRHSLGKESSSPCGRWIYTKEGLAKVSLEYQGAQGARPWPPLPWSRPWCPLQIFPQTFSYCNGSALLFEKVALPLQEWNSRPANIYFLHLNGKLWCSEAIQKELKKASLRQSVIDQDDRFNLRLETLHGVN